MKGELVSPGDAMVFNAIPVSVVFTCLEIWELTD